MVFRRDVIRSQRSRQSRAGLLAAGEEHDGLGAVVGAARVGRRSGGAERRRGRENRCETPHRRPPFLVALSFFSGLALRGATFARRVALTFRRDALPATPSSRIARSAIRTVVSRPTPLIRIPALTDFGAKDSLRPSDRVAEAV